MRPPRPALRWFGGKYSLAESIVSLFPPHRIYVEPFGGAASVLLAKPRAYNEVWNDLDGELVNFFEVLRSDDCEALLKRIRETPYSRAEYRRAYKLSQCPVERAARLVIRSHMAHGSSAARIDKKMGFRVDGINGTTNVAGEWVTLPLALEAVAQRMRGVIIEQKPAIELIARYSDPKCLLYVDPPYLPETRSRHGYAHDMTKEDHEALLAALLASESMVVLSGYAAPLYDEALTGWHRIEVAAWAHGSLPRREVLWMNQAAAPSAHGPLFERAVA